MTELNQVKETTEEFYSKLNNGGYITKDSQYILKLDWKGDIKILTNPAYDCYDSDEGVVTFDEDLANELLVASEVIEAVKACRKARSAVLLADRAVKSLDKDAK